MDFTVIFEWTNIAALLMALVVGYIIKHAIKNERVNDFIPLICALVGVIIVLAVDIPTGEFTVYSVVIGAISGIAATGVYEAFANFIEKDKKQEE